MYIIRTAIIKYVGRKVMNHVNECVAVLMTIRTICISISDRGTLNLIFMGTRGFFYSSSRLDSVSRLDSEMKDSSILVAKPIIERVIDCGWYVCPIISP